MVAPIVTALVGLAQIAPSLAKFLGAGERTAAVAEQVAGIAQAVTGTPNPAEALTALRENAKLAHEFNLRVLAMDGELEQSYLADRADARRRDVALVAAGRSNTRADVMVAVDALGLIACLVVLVFFRKDMPGEVVGLVSTVASIFGLCLRDAHQFEFGTSRGSRDKDQLLAQLNRAAAPDARSQPGG